MHFHDGIAHDHMHEHEHSHGASGPHVHGEVAAFDSDEQAVALMSYMLDHNKHHAEELHELAHKLDNGGKDEAAHLIEHALEHYFAGNEELAKALESMKKGE